MRLFDTGLRIFGGFVYYGVLHYVSRHYLVYASRSAEGCPTEAVVMTIRYDPGFDDKMLSVYVRVERDDKVRLPLVWFRCVEPLTTCTALHLGGCVFASLRQPVVAPCTSIIYLVFSSPTI